MHHGGDAGGEEGDHLLARALLAGGGAVRLGGHLAVHHGHVHASLLEHVAALQDARDAAAAAGARPGILLELLAVQLLDRAANLILRGADHLLEACAHGVGVVLAALAEKRQGSLVDGDLLLDADSADVRLARGARGDAGARALLEALVERRTYAARGSGEGGLVRGRPEEIAAARGSRGSDAAGRILDTVSDIGFRSSTRGDARARRASIRTCAGLATAMVIAEAIVTVNEVDEARDGDVYVRA